jgi:thiamine biosynthesis lipoprotein
MGGPCEVLVEVGCEREARGVAETVMACAERIERKFSRYLPDNIIARINTAGGAATCVDDETANLLDFAARMHELSDGMFDITSGVLRRAWTFDGGGRVPSAEDVAALLPLVGWAKARWDRPYLTLLPGMQIDFGGIAKEYAVDQAVREAASTSGAPVLVNFGGDLAVTRRREQGQSWRIGIEGVGADAGVASMFVDLSAGAVATSGDTYRFVQAGSQRLPHILDPRGGRPIADAPRTVTVAAPSCTQAGMLTTLAMLKGPDAELFLRSEGVRFWIQRLPGSILTSVSSR